MRPGIFMTNSDTGRPVLYIGNDKQPLDDGTALLWLQVLHRYFETKIREVVREKK